MDDIHMALVRRLEGLARSGYYFIGNLSSFHYSTLCRKNWGCWYEFWMAELKKSYMLERAVENPIYEFPTESFLGTMQVFGRRTGNNTASLR